jgi:hypothetical protein
VVFPSLQVWSWGLERGIDPLLWWFILGVLELVAWYIFGWRALFYVFVGWYVLAMILTMI